MGLFNKIFNSNSENTQNDNTMSRKRANSINTSDMHSVSTLLDTTTHSMDLNDETYQNTHLNNNNSKDDDKDFNKNNDKDKSDTLHHMARISRAYTTVQLLNRKSIGISDFLEYWRKENLAMFHPEKNREEYLTYKPGNSSSFSINKNVQEEPIFPARKKSCFKKGTLMEHKKRLIQYQQSRLSKLNTNETDRSSGSSLSKGKTKNNFTKMFFGSGNNSKSSNINDNNKIPLKDR